MFDHVLPGFWSVGAEVTDLADGVLVRRPGLAAEPSATFLYRVRAGGPAALDALLDQAARAIGGPVPRLYLDGETPRQVEAELAARDWSIEGTLQLVLPDGLDLAAVPDAPIRPAQPADWDALHSLFRADHEEDDRRAGHDRPRAEHLTDRVVQARRALSPPVRYFVVDVGEIVGFMAGWPGGDDGIGLVEDLYVRPDHRRQHLATALIATTVHWARAGGAGDVVIGADVDDTPKQLYRRLGFAPNALLRTATAPAGR